MRHKNNFNRFKIFYKIFHLSIFILLLSFISCQYLEKPKNFLSEEQMADILLDMAIFDDLPRIDSNIKSEETYKHLFLLHNINMDDYIDNYAYYASQKKIKYIISLAEKKLMNKDPKIKEYIKEKTDGI